MRGNISSSQRVFTIIKNIIKFSIYKLENVFHKKRNDFYFFIGKDR